MKIGNFVSFHVDKEENKLENICWINSNIFALKIISQNQSGYNELNINHSLGKVT